MRDLFSHHYFQIDPVIVRKTIDEPLDRLEVACAELLRELKAR